MQNETYFMSQTDRDAVFGRLVRQQREQDTLIADLVAEAKHFSSALRFFSDLLHSSPEAVIFPGQVNKKNPLASIPNVDPLVLDAERIKNLVESLRNALLTRDELTEQLRRYPAVS